MNGKSKDESFEYSRSVFNVHRAIELNRTDVIQRHYDDGWRGMNENFYYPMPPGFLLKLPLILALECKAYESLKWLLEHGSDPYKICRNRRVQKNAFQLAKELNDEAAMSILNEYRNEKER